MNDDPPALDDWDPLRPIDIPGVFARYPAYWAIGGGWALDLFVGRQTRHHADIDVQVDRADANLLHTALDGWELYLADGVVTRWHLGDPIPASTSDIWCRWPDGPWQFQILLGPFDDDRWYYRRDHSINRTRETATIVVNGLPVVAPDIQLLYKARPPQREKDEQDFQNVLPHLDGEARTWLAGTISRLYPDHHWLAALNNKPGGQGMS